MKIKQTLCALLVAGAIALTGCDGGKPAIYVDGGIKLYETSQVIKLLEGCEKIVSKWRNTYTCQKNDGSHVEYWLGYWADKYEWHERGVVPGNEK